MGELQISTPALLFSAISLILLAHTNRFLTYSNLVRQLHDQYVQNSETVLIYQMKNLRGRLVLIKGMQVSGILSLLLCVLSMFLIYIHQQLMAEVLFGLGMIALVVSLILSLQEIRISTRSLDYHLSDIEKSTDERK